MSPLPKLKFNELPKQDLVSLIRSQFHDEPIFAGAVMPIRGAEGFRRLDIDYCKEKLNVKTVMDQVQDVHMNALGVVIKDTEGMCLWDTKIGWNPTERDILGEFNEECRERDIKCICSFTSMNDAYQGYLHPERASIHGKSGKNFKKGDRSTHDEGEMRVIPEEGHDLSYYKELIPFLTDRYDPGTIKAGRGKGYVPTTTFMCPTSEHVDYLLGLVQEVVEKYRPGFIIADYIRYDGSFTDLCACERCQSKFHESHPQDHFGAGKKWLDWREDNIVAYAQRFQDTVKSIDSNCITGWFCLPGPPLFTRNHIAQNWEKLSTILDCTSPMIYPYLTGTELDGLKWKILGDLAYVYSVKNMEHRFKEFKNPVLTITNTVECSAREMVKQMRAFNFGLGIALFKYEGTSPEQWAALKKYAEEDLKLGLH